MKTTLPLLLLSATLGFAEVAPAPAPLPAEADCAHEPALLPAEVEAELEAAPAETAPAEAACDAAKPCREAALQSRVTLSDGSVLHGTIRRRVLPAETDSLGRLRIDLAAVESIEAAAPQDGTAARYRIAFRNGDRLSVRFPDRLRSIPFDTLLGRLRLPLASVASLAIEGETAEATGALLYHCTFDDVASVERPAAGPAGKFLRGDFVPGKNGNALLVKAGTHAAEVPFPTGLMQPQGCIEFWGKIPGATMESTFPDGGNPQFFAMGVGKYVNTFVKYTSNDGFGTSGLHADLPGSAYVSSSPSTGLGRYPAFLGDPSAWHHYALVWSDKGLDAASEALGRRVVSALYVDGLLVNPSYGHNGPDRAKFLSEFVCKPVVLAFPIVPGRQDLVQNRVDYLIDDFKIWNFPKTDFSFSAPSSEPRLVYHCTFDDAASIERPAAGPNGKFLGGTFVPGKVGNALRTFADEPTAEVDFEPGTLGSRGTIEFWAKKEGSADGEFADSGSPRFFGLWLYATGETPPWCSTHFEFSTNDGMGMSGLCGMVNHCSWATKPSFGGYPYDLIRDSLTEWHHYAVVWDAEGLSGTKASDGGPAVVAVFLDGNPVSTQGRQTVSFGGKHLKAIPSRFAKLAFPTPSNGWGSTGDHVPFLIDEFKIWSAPKTDIAISETQPCDRTITEPPKLLYHCTFDDAAGVENSAIGPKGKFLGGEFLPGKVGNALRVYADTPAAQTAFKPGDLGMRGTIEFWAKMEDATPETVFGDGGNPRFFCLWADLDKPVANTRSSYLQWSGNDGGGRSGLCAMVSGCSATSEAGWGMRRYPAFLGSPSDWHHYAVVWDENGVFGTPSVVAVYVDGKLVPTDGRNALGIGRKFKSFLEGPVLLGFPQRENEREPAARHVPFLIDEFKIWSAPVVQTADLPGA